jgi:hypothetical protein
MNTSLYRFLENNWFKHPMSQFSDDSRANLILSFASKTVLETPGIYALLKSKFPDAEICMCSTSGEIFQEEVLDDSFVVIAIELEKTKIEARSVNIKDYSGSYEAAVALAMQLPADHLTYIMVLSDGSLVNGSELVKGLVTPIGKNIVITGGLAGDGAHFRSSLVGLNGQPEEGRIVAIGFYGENIRITHGTQGGWDIFGLEKRITSSAGNVLFEIEGHNALELYKKYLGAEAENLPGSALLFPLSVILPGATKPVVRTILSINEEDKSMTFAGDVPVGSTVRFMKADFGKLALAALEAANHTYLTQHMKPGFSLLISCVGRKLILGSRIEEEVKAVSSAFGANTLMAGFYSNGEISPFNEGGNCQLHNQSMTVTSFYEF